MPVLLASFSCSSGLAWARTTITEVVDSSDNKALNKVGGGRGEGGSLGWFFSRGRR